MLPAELTDILPAATAAAWPKVVSVLPDGAYLAGGTALAVHLRHRISRDLDVLVRLPFDSEAVRAGLDALGSLTVTLHSDDTLNGLFEATKVQFLEAVGHRLLDEPVLVAGMPVAGVRDIMADKLRVLRDRGELRDYFDLMAIEEDGVHRCEQGLRYYRQRYGLGADDRTIAEIVRGLGFLDDVASDPGLPVPREHIEQYWAHRQPQIAASLRSAY